MSQLPRAEETRSGIFQAFFRSEVSGSLVLLFFTMVALVWANSPWAESYLSVSHTYLGLSWGGATFQLSLQHWINDGLMVVFFFVVGLEIKREVVVGELSSVRQAFLPVMAALGGMIAPAGLYLAMNAGGPGASGWGVPMATDIAFALGILALFGTRAPIGLKVFLTALAIADDIGAVLVIALFYTETILVGALIVAGVALLLLALANRVHVRRPAVYVLLALVVWVAVFASGIHATVAGILVALVVPVRARIRPEEFLSRAGRRLEQLRQSELTRQSMLSDTVQLDAIEDLYDAAADLRPPGISMEHFLHPVQAFLILPLFALFNAGVVFGGEAADRLTEPVTLGIVLGLFLGKQLGVTLFSWLAIRSGRAVMPDGVSWPMLWGVSALAGVGFTMSIFISDLAFASPALVDGAKLGILVASLASGIWGYLLLRWALGRR